jgi:hypothetical protein
MPVAACTVTNRVDDDFVSSSLIENQIRIWRRRNAANRRIAGASSGQWESAKHVNGAPDPGMHSNGSAWIAGSNVSGDFCELGEGGRRIADL